MLLSCWFKNVTKSTKYEQGEMEYNYSKVHTLSKNGKNTVRLKRIKGAYCSCRVNFKSKENM